MGFLSDLFSRLGRVWLRYRGDRLVTCPETRQPVGVALDVRHAAWSGLGHAPSLRLETCSRWPERRDCGQECLRQIEHVLQREPEMSAVIGEPVSATPVIPSRRYWEGVRTLCDRYVPFTQVTEDALLYACDALHLPLDAASRGLLMHEYTQLSAFSDVVPALRRIQHADVTLGVLSNGDPGLLEDALHSAQLDEYFDVILSVDQVRAYLVRQGLVTPEGEAPVVERDEPRVREPVRVEARKSRARAYIHHSNVAGNQSWNGDAFLSSQCGN